MLSDSSHKVVSTLPIAKDWPFFDLSERGERVLIHELSRTYRFCLVQFSDVARPLPPGRVASPQ